VLHGERGANGANGAGKPDAPRMADLCREINGRITVYAIDEDDSSGWICECESGKCFQPLTLKLAEYRAVRAHPRRYLVAPNAAHVDDRVDEVVERRNGYWVVEKDNAAVAAESLAAAEALGG
jgi:hypothetical protein